MQGSALFWWTGLVVGVLVVVSCGVQAQEAESRLWFEGEPEEDLEVEINRTHDEFQVYLTYEVEGAICSPGFFTEIPLSREAAKGLFVYRRPVSVIAFLDQPTTEGTYEQRETVDVSISATDDASPGDRLGFAIHARAPAVSPPTCQPGVPEAVAVIEGNVTVGAGDRKVKADGQGGEDVPEILIDEQEGSVVPAPSVVTVLVIGTGLALKQAGPASRRG